MCEIEIQKSYITYALIIDQIRLCFIYLNVQADIVCDIWIFENHFEKLFNVL